MKKPQPLDILIVAAHAAELKNLATLGRRHAVIKNRRAFLAAGIGPVAATFGLTHFLEDYRPKLMISLGTAGAIARTLNIGDLVHVKSVTTVSAQADAYTPAAQPARLKMPPQSNPAAKKFQPPLMAAHVYAPQEITRGESRVKTLQRANFDCEHLEAFAFAFVAKKFAIPYAGFLGITNRVGPHAHIDWKKNQDNVCKDLARMIKNLLKRDA